MFTIKKILVPIDFEQGSLQVEETAQGLARLAGAELIVMHVLNDIPIMLGEGPGYLPPEMFSEYEARAKELLAQGRARAEAADVQARILLVRGFSEVKILEAASKEGVDLIVMGTHGRRGFQHFMLGSIAERVVRASPIPVLTVRNGRVKSEKTADVAAAPGG